MVNAERESAAADIEEIGSGPRETIYLLSDAKVQTELISGIKTPLSDCVPADKVRWDR